MQAPIVVSTHPFRSHAQQLANQVADYYVEAIEAGVYSCRGGEVEAAKTDIAVLTRAGQLQGSPEELQVEDFWYFKPLREAKAKLGTN